MSQPQPANAQTRQKVITPRAFNKGRLTCGHCRTKVPIQVEQPAHNQLALIDCPCGMQYEIITEVRRHIRKQTSFQGAYRKVGGTNETGQIVVEDISFGGIRFRLLSSHTIAPGDPLHLQFAINDPHESKIVEQVRARYVDAEIVGAEFANAETIDRALALYLIQ